MGSGLQRCRLGRVKEWRDGVGFAMADGNLEGVIVMALAAFTLTAGCARCIAHQVPRLCPVWCGRETPPSGQRQSVIYSAAHLAADHRLQSHHRRSSARRGAASSSQNQRLEPSPMRCDSELASTLVQTGEVDEELSDSVVVDGIVL